MDSYRITIRNVNPETADMLREVAVESGYTLGEAFDQAVEHWYACLPITNTMTD